MLLRSSFAKTHLLTQCVFKVSAFGFNACTKTCATATVWLLHQ